MIAGLTPTKTAKIYYIKKNQIINSIFSCKTIVYVSVPRDWHGSCSTTRAIQSINRWEIKNGGCKHEH